MEQQILQDLTPSKRIQILKDTCEETTFFDFERELTPEEHDKVKDESVFKTSEIFKLQEEKKEKTKKLTDELKDKIIEQKILVKQAKTGKDEVNEEVFLLADQEQQIMGYYDKEGVLVYQRALMKNERQIRAVFDQTGTE